MPSPPLLARRKVQEIHHHALPPVPLPRPRRREPITGNIAAGRVFPAAGMAHQIAVVELRGTLLDNLDNLDNHRAGQLPPCRKPHSHSARVQQPVLRPLARWPSLAVTTPVTVAVAANI